MSASCSHSPVKFIESACFDTVLNSNVWTAGGQATLALVAAKILGYEQGWVAATLIFVLSLFVYNLDHLVDTRSNRQRERRARLSIGILFATVGVTGVLGMAFLLPGPALVVLALPFTIGTLYSLPVLLLPGRWRLRDIPLLKTPLVAGSVVWCAVLLPMVLDHALPDLTAFFLASHLFVFAFSNCVTSDLRDIEDDRSTRTLTFPALLGERGCRRLLIGLNILTLCVLPFWLPPRPVFYAALVGATVATLWYVIHLKNSSSAREFAFLVDGCPYVLLISMLS
jgi:4-hydroxybenzoate polyprenyltransferase